MTTTLTAGVWTHVAAVKNGAGLQLYKNGALVASPSTAAGAVATDANEVGVGGDNNGTPLWSDAFKGGWTTCGSTRGADTGADPERHDHSGAGGGCRHAAAGDQRRDGSAAAQVGTVTWTTDEGSTSQVEYGHGGYGSTTVLDCTLVTSHPWC